MRRFAPIMARGLVLLYQTGVSVSDPTTFVVIAVLLTCV